MERPDQIILNVAHASSAESLHEMLAAVLDFPDYYGKNWDAFWDCLRDPEQSSTPHKLVIKGLNVLAEQLPHDASLLRHCLLDGQQEIVSFEVVFEDL